MQHATIVAVATVTSGYPKLFETCNRIILKVLMGFADSILSKDDLVTRVCIVIPIVIIKHHQKTSYLNIVPQTPNVQKATRLFTCHSQTVPNNVFVLLVRIITLPEPLIQQRLSP